jgi:uncharacterized protein
VNDSTTDSGAGTGEFAPFLKGLAAREIRMPSCDSCGEYHWYPQPRCPYCGAAVFAWKPLPPHGQVFTSTVVRRALVKGAGPPAPFGIALVSLDAAPQCRLVVNTADPEGLPIGSPVDLVFGGDAADAMPRAVLRNDKAASQSRRHYPGRPRGDGPHSAPATSSDGPASSTPSLAREAPPSTRSRRRPSGFQPL